VVWYISNIECSAGKRKYELHIHTDCDELVRLIGWKYGEDNLRVMSMREEQLDVLNQPSGQLDRYYIMLIVIILVT